MLFLYEVAYRTGPNLKSNQFSDMTLKSSSGGYKKLQILNLTSFIAEEHAEWDNKVV